ncbi:hypothetical protein CAEBREN_31860 [Caenorhabditis brenneri]|uniref:BRCT domain-containing protein n=1 Tax=Caenorhabditis brenneri TaxID=135651 RepID=G0NQL5_CAEBE|nr:hypothetical protein CAEBREN_31860 [Caenorhabditis brenneri]
MKSIFWIIILLIPSVLPNGTKDKSDLGLIAADFQTLSRVTNAIVLQASITEKTVDASEVIAEFLGIDPKNFADIVAIDASKAKSLLENVAKGRDQLLKDSPTSTTELDSFKKSLSEIHDLLQKKDMSLKSIEENLKGKLTELKTNSTLLAYDCTLLSYSSMFYKFLQNAKGSPDDNSKDSDFKTLKKFRGNFENLIKCYTNLIAHGQRIEKFDIWSIMEEYDNAMKEAPELIVLFKNLKSSIFKLKKDLDASSSGWKNIEKQDISLGKQLHLVHQAHSEYVNQFIAPPRSFTGAFIETKDTLRVFEDLDSPWFKKHIARGANTQELKSSLEPFKKMSKAVYELGSKWKSFREIGLPNDMRKALEEVYDKVRRIEDFAKDPGFTESVDQFVESMENIIGECVKNPDDNFEETLEQFKQQETLQTELENELVVWKKKVKDKLEYADFSNTTKYIDCLNDIKESVPATIQKDEIYNIAGKMTSTFVECSEEKISLVNYFERFENMPNDRDALNGALQNFDETIGSLRLENVLAKGNGYSSIECMRNKNFNTTNLSKVVDFVSNFRNFPNAVEVNISTGYLRQIAEIKTVLSNTVSVFRELGSRSKRDTNVESDSIPILENSTLHAQTISECTRALLDLTVVRNNRKELTSIGSHFTDSIVAAMEEAKVSETVIKAPKSIDKLLKQADKIDVLAKDLRSQPLKNMSKVFWEVSKIDGFDQERQKIWNLKKQHEGDLRFRDVMSEWDTLIHTNLDFARYKRSLKKGFTTVLALDEYFDQLFHSKRRISNENQAEDSAYIYLIVFGSIGFFIFLVFAAATIYGCTESGKERYTNWFLYWRGKSSDYEKRWRYSRFFDYGGGNVSIVLSDALNVKSLPKTLSNGHYINAYDVNGETALHEATRYCKPKNVKTLIKHGIDRTLLNKSNKTAEELIPKKPTEETAAGFAEIQEIFNKYRNKKFRKSIPHRFKPSQYNIWMTEGTDEKTRDAFHEKFPRISKYEAEGTVTHVVVKVDSDGVYETNDPKMLTMIFRGCILVKESWLAACNRNGSAIEHDHKHLVEKIKYEGEVYNTVLKWANAMAKSEIPYLFGVSCLVFIPEGLLNPEAEPLCSVIKLLGGEVHDRLPSKKDFNIGSHPYLHSNLPPIFVIRPESTPAGADDYFDFGHKDTLFKPFSEKEFWRFLLKREINRDMIGKEQVTEPMRFWILVIAFLIPWSFTNGASKEKSNLELITADFQILARVTNAITLQMAANKKEANASEIIAELLRIHDGSFLEIVNIDTQKAITKLEKLENDVKNLEESHEEQHYDKGSWKDAREDSPNWLETVEETPAIFDVVGTWIENLKELDTSCPKTVTDALSGLYGNSVANQETLIKLKDFKANIDQISKCFDSLVKFFDLSDEISISSIEYKNLIDLLGNADSIFKNISEKAETLEATFQEMTQILNDDYQVLKEFTRVFSSHLRHSERVDPPLASYTVAFLDPQELLEVKNDMKSPWFKKHVVRGASIKNLEKYLEPFHQFSIVMLDLVKIWEPFHRLKLDQYKSLKAVVDYLTKMRDSLQIDVSMQTMLMNKESSSLIKTCHQKLIDEHIHNFKNGDKSFTDLLKKIGTFQQNVVLKLFDQIPKDESFEDYLTNCFLQLNFLVLDDANKLPEDMKSDIKTQYETCTKSSGFNNEMDRTIEKILKVLIEVKTLLSTAQAYEASQKNLNLESELKESGLQDALQCLRAVRYKELEHVSDLVEQVIHFPNHQIFIDTREYLENITQIKESYEKVENKLQETKSRSKRSKEKEYLIDNSLNNSKLHAENIGVCALALVNFNQVRENREILLNALSSKSHIRRRMKKARLNIDIKSEIELESLLKQADNLDELAKKLRTKSLQEMSAIFEATSKIQGFKTDRNGLFSLRFKKEFQDPKVKEELDVLVNTNLDFALYESRVKDGYFTVKALISYFDLILGHTKAQSKPQTIVVEKHVQVPNALSWLAIICIAIGVVFLILIIALTIYGFTAKGKENFRFPEYGNTALHSAARLGYSELVEILIRHGADRSLLNVGNLTAEQCVPVKGKDKTEASLKVQAIFAKYKKKKFRKQVPLRFPSSSFHIYIEDDTDEKLTDAFVEKFQAITSFELGTKTTHCVVKTDANGILETDSLELLSLIFHGIIFVKESWMKDCCENPKLIEQDFKYLVEKVRYKGKVYDTVVQWSMAMAKGEIPYLNNIVVAVVMTECDNFINLNNMVIHHGSSIAESFPTKEQYRIGARPYLHAHLGPIFLIHNGKFDLTLYKNDPDKMYTLFTEEEFLIFMLKREINRDTRENPLSIYPDAMLANF